MTAVRATFLTRALGFACIILAGILVGLANLASNYDDAFITFRCAFNLAIGEGFVYNTSDHVLSTTAPLFGLILGCLGWLFGPESIPVSAGIISAFSQVAAGLALFEYGREQGKTLCGFFAGLFYVSNSFLPLTFGGEMPFVVSLILWAFVTFNRGQSFLASFLLSVSFLSRPDSALAAIVLTLNYLWTKRKLPVREMLLAALIITPFLVASYFYYGSLLPTTLGAKIAQGKSGQFASFTLGILEWLKPVTALRFDFLPHFSPTFRFLFYLIVGGIFFLHRYRFWFPILAWSGFFYSFYVLLAVPFYHWYLVPIVLAILIFAACIAAGVVELGLELADRCRFRFPTRALTGSLVMLLILIGARGKVQEARRAYVEDPVEVLYEKAGMWFRFSTDKGARIGYQEIGFLGYYSRRNIVDPMGLLDPEVGSHLANGDLTWAFRQYKPEFIVHTDRFRGPLLTMLSEDWFRDSYKKVHQIEQPGTRPLIIFMKRD